MLKIFLVILMFKNIIADEEESNEKYIDLLPEEEKQEFLNIIARRILERIKSNGTPNESHADITDDQLDTHNEFIHEILKQESKNFKRAKNLINSNNQDKTIQYDQRDINKNKKGEHIDLTLRQNRRQKRKNSDHNIEKEPQVKLPHDFIPVKTVYDKYESNNNLKKSSKSVFTPPKNSEQDNEGNIRDENKEINTSDPGKNIILSNKYINNDLLNKSEKVEGVRKSYHNEKLGTTIITDFEPNSNENILTTGDYNMNNDDITPIPVSIEFFHNISDENIWSSTQKIYAGDSGNEKDSHMYKTTKVYNNITDNELSRREYVEVANNSESESKNVSIINNDTNFILVKNLQDKLLQISTKSDEHQYKNASKERSSTETVVLTETILPFTSFKVVTTKYVKPMKEENFGITENPTKIINISILNVSEFVTGIKLNTDKHVDQTKLNIKTPILRARPNLDDMVIDNNEFLQKLDANTKNEKWYEVYEVDDSKPQFVSTAKTKENEYSYYVPVYNYAPNNAYYRPYSKFGPNVEVFENGNTESKEVEDSRVNFKFNGRNSFSGYSNKKTGRLDTRNAKQSSTKQNKPLFEILKPLTQKQTQNNIYYNPYDYPDIDYYLGRILRQRTSDETEIKEPDHSISKQKNDIIKDHVRAIRKHFYLQKLFGYVPAKNDNGIRKANQYFTIGTTSKNPREHNIAIDYYFGRADSDEQDENSGVFRVKESKFRYKYPTVMPFTPNPLIFRTTLEDTKPFKNNIGLEKIDNKSSNEEISSVHFTELFETILSVLKDMIRFNNKDLVKYDWLKSTVNIQAAVRKLMDLIEQLQHGKYVHPKDIELIKYILYLFKSSKTSVGDEMDTEAKRVKKFKNRNDVLPKTKRKTKMKDPLKLWRDFLTYLRSTEDTGSEEQRFQLLYEFEIFLQNLLFHLNDLHEAIKDISMITKYKNQNWFQDIKDLLLEKANKKSLAQLVLHLSLSKLLDLIEDSATDGAEEGFRSYVKNNKEDAERSREEFLFVLHVLEELLRMNN